jgi:hypothetical protein
MIIMDVHEISFENLPKVVAHLVNELAEIKSLVEKGQQTPIVPQKRVPIGIEDACWIIGKAKPTVYALVRKRLLPCYLKSADICIYIIGKVLK